MVTINRLPSISTLLYWAMAMAVSSSRFVASGGRRCTIAPARASDDVTRSRPHEGRKGPNRRLGLQSIFRGAQTLQPQDSNQLVWATKYIEYVRIKKQLTLAMTL